MRSVFVAFLLFGFVISHLLADNAGNVVGAGYSPAAPIILAPGQIVTVFVTGLTVPASPISATTVPLPYKLGGISATLLPGPVPVPILGISSVNTCLLSVPTPGLSCGTVMGVTVQIPFELIVDSGTESPPTASYLSISDDSGHAASIRVLSAPDQIHAVVKGNVILANGIVTHADGTTIDSAHPARPGEEVVMYAFGLGKTMPVVATGAASPSPAAVSTQSFHLNFDYRPNAMPSPGLAVFGSPSGPVPLFAGLTPNLAGLYQINFVIPPPSVSLSSCTGSSASRPVVLSNLTVTLVGVSSFDGAGICVAAGP